MSTASGTGFEVGDRFSDDGHASGSDHTDRRANDVAVLRENLRKLRDEEPPLPPYYWWLARLISRPQLRQNRSP